MNRFQEASERVGFDGDRNAHEWPTMAKAKVLVDKMRNGDEEESAEAFDAVLRLFRFGTVVDRNRLKVSRFLARNFIEVKREWNGEEPVAEDFFADDGPSDGD